MDPNLANAMRNQICSLLGDLVASRPIAWITSLKETGNLNASPFSVYN